VIRLVISDVDGTLVTQEKKLTDGAIAAARELKSAGVTLAITSGRPPRGMQMLVEPLRLEDQIAGFNGGVFVYPDMRVASTRLLPADEAKEAVRLILAAELDAWLYTTEDWLIRDQYAPHVAREAKTVAFDAKVVRRFTDEHFANAVKVVGVSDDYANVARCEKTAQTALGARASVSRSQPYYLDVTHPLANKGEVATTLSKLLGIEPAEIATIGDGPNDVLMFVRSGFSIAMGNASDEVRAKASAVTATNEEEGFAKAIRDLVLPRSRA
jgi:Cof subfamily protein (haloacid dehalogenase superfamily)